MAQIIPPITSLPIDSLAAPSAEDIQDRLPSICVDYLSHDWSEEDVWASWRSMTRHKHEIANGVRLENASWRTWNKQRNKLKTISPETLNWLKDSDVTWLYGPLHTAQVEPVRPLKVATTSERLGIDLPASPSVKPGGLKKSHSMRAPSKPILKHRTLSEMLTIPNPSSPILEASRYDDDDSSSDSHGGTARPQLIQTKSDTNIANSRTSSVRYRSPPRMPISGKVSPNSGMPTTPAGEKAASASSEKRHISFNTFVEQCVALSEPDLQAQDSDSEDDMLEIRSNSSRSSRGSRPSLSRNSSTASGSSEHMTIAKIAPTMLKTNGTFVSSHLPQMVYAPPPEYRSPQEDQASSANFDFPSPQVQKRDRWAGDDDDEYGSVGYDYFGGPNLGGAQQGQQQAAPSHVGASYGRSAAPTVNQAPAQPKWRQPSSSTNSSEPSSVSSSSSASLNNIASPPVPSRGILKVRPPGTTPPEPASPPQSSYFNYNPSPATGIGGMRGSYEYPNTLDETHRSPIQSPGGPGGEETRGRSAQRYPGASAYDRSASRGTSASSVSPGSIRTPPMDTSTGARRPVASPGSINAQSPPVPYQAHVQAAAPVGLNNPAYAAQSGNSAQSMDVDAPYQPERSDTPTPHSSPQISFRPLQDTSPASLPHNSSRPPKPRQSSSQTSASTLRSTQSSAAGASQTSMLSPELPKADPPTIVSPIALNSASAALHSVATTQAGGAGGQGGRATTALTGAKTHPTLSQPPTEDEAEGEGEDVEVADGSSIMGRAANIANTARDLIGQFWYGNEQPAGQGAAGVGQGGTGGGSGFRGISLGAALGGGVGGQNQTGTSNNLTRTWSGGRHKRGSSFG